MKRALAVFSLFLSLCFCHVPAWAQSAFEWRQSDTSVALAHDNNVVWQLNFGPELNVPYFHPVSSIDGEILTWDRPPDHAWHHGLWFCWKYINGVNYWEHERQTNKPAGRTEWSDVCVETKRDHSATISLKLKYHPASDDHVVLREARLIDIAAPDPAGEFHLDWTSEFTVGEQPVVLDRTPPKKQSWGGYAGLSLRFAKELSERRATSATGPAEFGSADRHRSRSTAMDYSGEINGKTVGVALLDHPENRRHPTPWYVIRSDVMSYFNAAVLQEAPLTLQPGESLTLRYRAIVHPGRWNEDRLQAAQQAFWHSGSQKKERANQ